MSSGPLLAEVIANPANIDARQVYADWLIEQSNPRGTFISQQIQLNEMTGWENNYPEMLANSQRIQHQYAGSGWQNSWMQPKWNMATAV